ncbi:MAG TPA: hypothetical protein VLC92_05600 [Rhodocyclaceae bacterium]|nr:hypothetical protein [Rhodocyclaceae bacterium]
MLSWIVTAEPLADELDEDTLEAALDEELEATLLADDALLDELLLAATLLDEEEALLEELLEATLDATLEELLEATLLEAALDEELLVPQAAAVSTAPFLPTPA